jgi:hypothetical protein
MANRHSYTITIDNNVTEKEALSYLIESNKNYIHPTNESRKLILELLGVDKKFYRAFDLILIPGHTNLDSIIKLNNLSAITLIELKTTRKRLVNLPKGFFFGATESEFELAKQLGDQYKFCFVSLHPETISSALLSLEELNRIIKTKRIQYQINL